VAPVAPVAPAFGAIAITNVFCCGVPLPREIFNRYEPGSMPAGKVICIVVAVTAATGTGIPDSVAAGDGSPLFRKFTPLT
jgi:hypothetical protein